MSSACSRKDEQPESAKFPDAAGSIHILKHEKAILIPMLFHDFVLLPGMDPCYYRPCASEGDVHAYLSFGHSFVLLCLHAPLGSEKNEKPKSIEEETVFHVYNVYTKSVSETHC